MLWISRHEMTGEQLEDLERVMGGPVTLLPWRDTVRDAELRFLGLPFREMTGFSIFSLFLTWCSPF